MKHIRRILTALCFSVGALIYLNGCATMAPSYTQPPAPVPAAWPAGAAYKADTAKQTDPTAAEIKWRDFFINDQLRKLIELALKNNRDLRVAALTIERSRAQYQIQRADLLPTVNANGAATIQRIPADLSSSGKSMIARQYGVNLGLSTYELDFFGRVRSLKDQALEQFLATEQARHSVQISLVSEVATTYLTLAADREYLRLARETLASQQASYQLFKSRFEAGASSELDVRQAQTGVDTARVDIARFTTQAAQAENALALLVGAPVPADLLPNGFSEVGTLKEFRAGLPSEVLQHRPDIMQAEELLKAANANIGAARAAFFPRITLNTSIGTSSDQLAALFSPGSAAWLFAPQITLPIFDSGRNRAGLTVAEVDRDIALARYEQAIQSAFRDVADAQALRGTVGDQLEAQQSLVQATSQSYRLSDARYRSGIDSYLNVLDAQRSNYSSQQGLIGIQLSRLINLVTMYKVFGGGSGE